MDELSVLVRPASKRYVEKVGKRLAKNSEQVGDEDPRYQVNDVVSVGDWQEVPLEQKVKKGKHRHYGVAAWVIFNHPQNAHAYMTAIVEVIGVVEWHCEGEIASVVPGPTWQASHQENALDHLTQWEKQAESKNIFEWELINCKSSHSDDLGEVHQVVWNSHPSQSKVLVFSNVLVLLSNDVKSVVSDAFSWFEEVNVVDKFGVLKKYRYNNQTETNSDHSHGLFLAVAPGSLADLAVYLIEGLRLNQVIVNHFRLIVTLIDVWVLRQIRSALGSISEALVFKLGTNCLLEVSHGVINCAGWLSKGLLLDLLLLGQRSALRQLNLAVVQASYHL